MLILIFPALGRLVSTGLFAEVFGFATKDGAMNLWATVNRSQPLQLLRDIRQLSLDDYDLIISDFGTGYCVGGKTTKSTHRLDLASVHQASFRYFSPVPANRRDCWPMPDELAPISVRRHFSTAPVQTSRLQFCTSAGFILAARADRQLVSDHRANLPTQPDQRHPFIAVIC